jgi:hypothetical protein
MNIESPRYIFAGLLQRDFVILPSGKTLLDVPGGNVLYAAVGLVIWEADPPPGIIARVGEDYPQAWLEVIAEREIDTRGVHILPDVVDLRNFYAYTGRETRSTQDPVTHFARIGAPFPRALLGYRSSTSTLDSRIQQSPTSLRQGDIPSAYLDATAAHLCPMDYLTHSLLPAILRRAALSTVTLDPSPGYMNPTFWGDVPAIITGLTAFLPSEEDLRFLFQGRSEDLWEMVEAVASFGCEIVVVKCGERGQLLYEVPSHNRWEIPAYASRVMDPSGAGNAFCGGFLAGYRHSYDPLEAVLYGNISASLVVEGIGPFYALDALPGLAQARLEAVRQMVRKV